MSKLLACLQAPEEVKLFTVNYEGIACLLVGEHKHVYLSSDRNRYFQFRECKDADESDGIDFYNLNRQEVENILNAFEFYYEGRLSDEEPGVIIRDEEHQEQQVCECGAEYTSVPQSHMNFCPLSK